MTKKADDDVLLQLNVKLPGNIRWWLAIVVVGTIANLFGWGVIHVG